MMQARLCTCTTTMEARISVPGHRFAVPPLASSMRPRRTVVHSTEGIKDLISRDRKVVDITDAFDDAPQSAAAAAAATVSEETNKTGSSSSSSIKQTIKGSSSSNSSSSSKGPKSRQQRQVDMAKAADVSVSVDRPRFKKCKDAIDAGLEAFQGREYLAAIDLFNTALELPGNGAYRLSGSPREYACPSDAEEHACMYNMACCYAQLGQQQAALTCLESILESGFKDISTLQSDPDLGPVQGPALQAIINKYTGIGGLFNKLLTRQKQEELLMSDDNKNKPWLMW